MHCTTNLTSSLIVQCHLSCVEWSFPVSVINHTYSMQAIAWPIGVCYISCAYRAHHNRLSTVIPGTCTCPCRPCHTSTSLTHHFTSISTNCSLLSDVPASRLHLMQQLIQLSSCKANSNLHHGSITLQQLMNECAI